MVFLAVGTNIVVRNVADIPYDPIASLWILGAFVGGTLLCLPAFVRAPRSRLARGAARLTIAAGLAVLLFDLSGAAAAPLGGVALGTADVAAAGLACAIALLAPFAVLERAGALAAVAIACSALVTQAPHWRGHRWVATSGAVAQRVDTPPRNGARGGTVYHIMLDAFQREAYDVLRAREPDLAFPGFTYYPKFTANYAVTWFSVPATLRGRLLAPGESIRRWRNVARTRDTIWAQLADAGIPVDLYLQLEFFCSPDARSCFTIGDALKAREDRAGGGSLRRLRRALLADLWFLQVLPRSVAVALAEHPGTTAWSRPLPDVPNGRRFSITKALAAVWVDGRAVTDTAPAGNDPPTVLDNASNALTLFDGFLQRETAKSPARRRYVYLHLILPHCPMTVDADCVYHGFRQRSTDAAYVEDYLAQARCSLRLVRKLLDLLAARDGGDEALIIIHSDHGAHPTLSRTLVASRPELSRTQDALEQRPGPWRARAGARWANRFVDLESNWWSPQTAALRSGGLLLVRFPGRTGFTAASGQAQMIDVAPTIARYFGLPTNRYAGMPLQDLATSTRAATRKVFHFAGFPAPDGPAPVLGGKLWRYAWRGDRWKLDGRVAVAR